MNGRRESTQGLLTVAAILLSSALNYAFTLLLAGALLAPGDAGAFAAAATLTRVVFFAGWAVQVQVAAFPLVARRTATGEPLRPLLLGALGATLLVLRLIVVTPDPVNLPHETTEYLITNFRESEKDRSPGRVPVTPAASLEVALLYARHPRIEQAYREVKQHLGWTHCQARSDIALRRHWSLVCAAFCFVHWWNAHTPRGEGETSQRADARHPPRWSTLLHQVRLWLEPFVWVWQAWRAFSTERPPRPLFLLLDQVGQGQPLPMYVA
ncbi:hypothetical protein GCM10010842_26340 [Deinococcus daejeonensis]|uniref:Transposase IS4-like domain-containing protein n=1 Tax=Deinococcus daejeonensis TaxID=1007098 RepID=A0ABQ2J9P8_9DEIO|nr:transposase [Deinococcus daejeonensis]GGN41002.1 hypothetical protein GCM10010842_26340 [Deinococcus daejeonensis]